MQIVEVSDNADTKNTWSKRNNLLHILHKSNRQYRCHLHETRFLNPFRCSPGDACLLVSIQPKSHITFNPHERFYQREQTVCNALKHRSQIFKIMRREIWTLIDLSETMDPSIEQCCFTSVIQGFRFSSMRKSKRYIE